MANTVNINQNNNNVSLQDNNRRIIITDNNAGTTINVTQPVTSIVTVSAFGPQGAQGPAGTSVNTGSFVSTSSFNAFTGSYNTGSFTGSFYGNLIGTSSYALTASYALNVPQTASYSLTASYALTADSASYALNANSASYALTASYVQNAQTASNILGGKATHVPFFITDTSLATSSLYQSGSSTVIINQDNATSANPEALYVFQPSPTSINVISGKGNLNNYLQLNIQNTNQGTNASSDVVATANNGNETTNYIDMGINSENYNSGFVGDANDAYLYSTGNHLHIGNVSNFPVQIFAGGGDVNIHNKLELNPNNQHLMSGSLDVSGSIKAFSFTGSLQGNATTSTTADTASYSTTLGASLSQPSNNQVRLLNSAGGTLNTITVDNVVSASHADNASTANYAAIAGNGGVTQITAGVGVTLIPSNGQGNVTVIATGTGGVTIISGSIVTGSFINTNSYTFNHNLGIRTPIITVFDSNYNQIIPENIQLVDSSSAVITFPTLESGFAIGSTGGTTGTALSSSYALIAEYANTASFYQETDPVYIAQKPTLATTGSNTFRGTQTISGSVTITGSLTVLGPSTFSGSVTLVNGATGSLSGTSSFAVTSSYALNTLSASYALNALSASYAQTASYALSALSASYAQTSSYAINMIISGGIASASYIDFNLNPGVADAIGRLKFDSGEGTLQLGLAGGNVILNVGEDLFQYVYNSTGAPLTKGQVVYISGSQGNRIAVKLASAAAEQGSANTLGFAAETIAAGGEGWIQTEGNLRKLNTVGLIGGQLLYLSTTPGAYTQTIPTPPNHSVRLGYAERIDNTQGSIYIKIDNGYEIGELHDIIDNTTTSSFGDLLVKSGSVWTNSKQLTGSYSITGSLTISGSSTFTNIGPANFTGSVNITGSTTQTGNNVLIGTTTLSGSINVSGSQNFNGSSSFFGNHILSGSNTIRGNTFMFGNIQVSGSSNFNNSEFIVTGSTSVLGNFNVRGTSVFSNTTFTVTGSQYFTGSSFINGNQSLAGNSTVTGSLNVIGNINVISGSSFTRWGNKLFNYGQFAHTASIPVTANVSASFILPLTYFNDGVSIVSGSRITFANTGLYNIQYSAIANQGSGTPNLRLWFKKTGSNIDNSTSTVQLQNNSQTALTYNFAFPFSASEYVELWYHSSTSNTSFPYAAAGSGFPASPSIILTVTQIA